jgi:hypothetical protein
MAANGLRRPMPSNSDANDFAWNPVTFKPKRNARKRSAYRSGVSLPINPITGFSYRRWRKWRCRLLAPRKIDQIFLAY